MLRTVHKTHNIYLIGLVSIMFVSLITIAFLIHKNLTANDLQDHSVDASGVVTGYPSTSVVPIPTEITPTHTLTPSLTESLERIEPDANYISVYITYYGWNDNDPAGTAIAYPSSRYGQTLHKEASGEGSYSNPITFASDPGIFPIGTRLYVPYLNKYVIMEDLCATCSGNHIDIWMQSSGSFESELYACQRSWTRSQVQVEIDPPLGRNTEYTPLFNQSTGECLQ